MCICSKDDCGTVFTGCDCTNKCERCNPPVNPSIMVLISAIICSFHIDCKTESCNIFSAGILSDCELSTIFDYMNPSTCISSGKHGFSPNTQASVCLNMCAFPYKHFVRKGNCAICTEQTSLVHEIGHSFCSNECTCDCSHLCCVCNNPKIPEEITREICRESLVNVPLEYIYKFSVTQLLFWLSNHTCIDYGEYYLITHLASGIVYDRYYKTIN